MTSVYRLSDLFYDRIYAERVDVPFYVQMAQRYPGPILEAACGTGRVLIPSARAGATILGFDICEPRLDLCRRKLQAESLETRQRARVATGNLLNCDFGSHFGLVTMPFRGFQDLLTVDEERQALLNMHRHLRPGGRLILDVFNPSIPFLADDSAKIEFLDSPMSLRDEGNDVQLAYRLIHRDYFAQTQELEEIIYVHESGGTKQRQAREFTTRYIFRHELEYLIELSGFEMERLYGDFDFSPYGAKYPGELIAVAIKR